MDDFSLIEKWEGRLAKPELAKLKTFTVDREELHRLLLLATSGLVTPGKEAFR